MRKTLSLLFALFFLTIATNSFAQTSAAKDSAKAAKKAARAQEKAEKKAAADAAKAKDVKNPTTTTTTPTTTTPATPKTTTPKTQPVNKSADKAVGTDAKGRTIYEGPRGGRYTLSPSGNKEYIKKEK